MLINLQSIVIDKPISGLTGISFNKCTTLADVLAAMVAQAGTGADIHAVSGVYDPATETIVITLSNNSTFSIPASLLLPVVADGVTITGNGTNANRLVGYQVAYDAATGALTITPPTGAAVVVPAQTATEEKAADPHNLLGLGVGATVTTQQMLDYLAAHLRDCCPDPTITISDYSLAVAGQPQESDINGWIATNGPYKPGTLLRYIGTGTAQNPNAVWQIDAAGAPIRVEAHYPSIYPIDAAFANPAAPTDLEAQTFIATNGPFPPNTLFYLAGAGSPFNPDYVWTNDPAGTVINLKSPACCPGDTLEIPASAFADPVNPTQAEADAWIETQQPLKAGTQIIYNRYTSGDVEDPDYVWLVNEIGDATNIESPNPTKAGAGLRNATATGLVQNVAKNPAFSQVAYAENATATTGANSSITVQHAGRYLVTASVWWASEAWTHECGMHGQVNVNGTTIYTGGRLDHSRKLPVDAVNGGASKFLSYSTEITCILPLVAGDVVTFTVVHDDIVAHNLLSNAGYSWFQVEKLS